MRRRTPALVLLTLLSTGGCYSYRTVRPDELRPRLAIRVRVTPEEGARVSEIVGYATRSLDGQVVRARPDTLLLAVPAQPTVTGATAQRFYQRVDLPVSHVIEVEQRGLDRSRTYAVVLGAAAVTGALVAWSFSALGSSSGQGDKGGTHN